MNRWLIIIFQHFLMLRKLISDVTNINLYVADAIFKYYDGLSERPLENILIGRPEASNSEYIPTWKIGSAVS